MSLDRSLRTAGNLARHRNVLTRAERLAKLASDGKWDESKSPLGLVKVANRKLAVGGKAKAETTAEGAAAAATPAAPAAAPASGAAKAPASAAKPAAAATKPAAKK